MTVCSTASPTMRAGSRPPAFPASGWVIRSAAAGRRSIRWSNSQRSPRSPSKVELGIGVLQLPLRHPIELAHRVQSVQALSANRLVLGVGSGSTKDDFDLLGYDYDERFRTLRSSLAIMRRAWRGEPANTGGTLSTWPGCEGGPPILIGAWRSHRWITLAAKEYQGWTPSGRYSSWDDLEAGMRVFREAGGTNAVLANVAVDLANRPGSAEFARSQSLADRHAGRGASEAEAHAADRFRRGAAGLAPRRAGGHRAGARSALTAYRGGVPFGLPASGGGL